MADDSDVVVAFRANLTEMDQQFTQAEQKVAGVGKSLEEAGRRGESFLGAFGGEGRHLRLLAMEMGSLDGAGQLASRGMFSALGAVRALNLGLSTMGGAIGLGIAAIGLIVTAFTHWHESATKAHEAQQKLVEDTVKGAKDIDAEYGGTQKQIDTLTGKIETLARRRSELRKAGFSERSDEMKDLRRLIQLVQDDIDSVNQYGLTVVQVRENQKRADKEWADAQLAYYKEVNDVAQRYLDLLAKIAGENYKAAEAVQKHFEQISSSVSSSLLMAAKAHENFLKAIRQQLIDWAEKMAAEQAVMEMLTLAFPGVGAGLAGEAGNLTPARNLLSLLGFKDMRTGAAQ